MEKKRTVYEKVIVAVVVALAVILAVGLYSARAKVEKSGALMNELGMLRSSINFYKVRNHANPASLEVLASETYTEDGVQGKYVENAPVDETRRFVDPFGNAYAYDSKTGWVNSTTKGCERW